MDLDSLIARCENELYFGFTNVEASGLSWLNVKLNSSKQPSHFIILKSNFVSLIEESLWRVINPLPFYPKIAYIAT